MLEDSTECYAYEGVGIYRIGIHFLVKHVRKTPGHSMNNLHNWFKLITLNYLTPSSLSFTHTHTYSPSFPPCFLPFFFHHNAMHSIFLFPSLMDVAHFFSSSFARILSYSTMPIQTLVYHNILIYGDTTNSIHKFNKSCINLKHF